MLGDTGLRHFDGQITEEFHPRLKGVQATRIYREMSDNDATVGASLGAVDILVRQVPWTVKPAQNNRRKGQARKWAEFLEGCITDMSGTWSDFISEVFSMLIYGYAPFEILYKVSRGDSKDPRFNSEFDDGLVRWRRFDIRAQESISKWEIDDDGGIQGFWQWTGQNGFHSAKEVFIPIEKALLFRTRSHKNNPEGRSMLRSSYRSWYALKRNEEIQRIGHERNLAGLPVLRVPPGVMDPNATGDKATQRANYQDLVQKIRVDEHMGVVMPAKIDPVTGQETGFDLELLSSGAKDLNSIQAVVNDLKNDLASGLHAEFIMVTRNSQGGGYAVDKNKTSFFTLTLKALLDSVESVINRFAVPRLMKLNNVPRELWPTIQHGEIVQSALQDVATYVATLGIGGDLETENELRRRANLPTVDEATERANADPSTQPPTPPTTNEPEPKEEDEQDSE